MKHKLNRLLSFGLCLFLTTPTFVFASSNQHLVLEKNINSLNKNLEVVQLPEMAILEPINMNEDGIKIAPHISVLETELRNFLDYFPDPNFAQGVAQHFGKNKEDQVTINELSSLKSIYLQRKKITSIEGVEYLKNLVSLNVSENQIQGIPSGIGNLINLKEFIIFSNEIKTIPAEIGNLKDLLNFSIGGNKINALPLELFTLIELRSLDIGANFITELPSDIGNLKNLTHLHSDRNRITSLPDEISTLSSLKYLYLGANFIITLPDNIGDLQNLIHLWVDANKLEKLPTSIGNLKNLTSLILGSNGYPVYLDFEYNGGNELTSIPSEIGNLKNLSYLKIQNNHLTEIPPEIGSLNNLTSLTLDSNQLTSLPGTLANLTNLESLWICNNKITSTIPSNLLNIVKLHYYNQSGELSSLRISDVNTIAYTELLSPLLLQIKSLNHNQLNGKWNIKKPNGSLITLIGGDGSEITPALFTDLGTYHVTFNWTGREPNVQNLDSRASNISSSIMVEIDEAQQMHNVNVITRYLDDALPEYSTNYQVAHGASFLKSFEVLDGYDLYNTMLLSMPEFIIDMGNKSVSLDVVERDYTILLEFDKSEYRVKLNTTYLDNALPDTTKTEWIRHDEDYSHTYQIAEGYQVANMDNLPVGVIVDEGNQTVTINNVTENYEIVLEFERKLVDVTITIVYNDSSKDDKLSTYPVTYGDSFETNFTFERGYSIKNVSFNASGVSVNRARQTVSIQRVTSSVNIIITVW